MKQPLEVPPPPRLSDQEKSFLVNLIPEALREVHSDERRESDSEVRPEEGIPPGLRQSAGVFVTLYHGSDLRGCIGQVRSSRPLWELTREMAVAAATRDPRFAPVDFREMSELSYEVSVLGTLVAVPAEHRSRLVRCLEIGTHGVQLRRGDRSGLLLPQVAEKFEWDAARLLAETARKAELEADSWQDPSTEVLVFRTLRIEGGA